MSKRIVIFCGGSGARELIRRFARRADVELTMIVNCFDDGLSTGQLRRHVPGMLGPSDVRKNVRHALNEASAGHAAFEHLLGYRFPEHSEPPDPRVHRCRAALSEQAEQLGALDTARRRRLARALQRFADHSEASASPIPLRDAGLGNFLFAGLYLESGNFNRAVQAFAEFFEIEARVVNVTDGADLKLVGLTDDDRLIPDEASISALSPEQRIADLFLLDRYLGAGELADFERLPAGARREYLKARHHTPRLNPEARAALRDADTIIYWPGTQHSSLLPSYLTAGLASAVVESRADSKILVTNIAKDRDIHRETAFSLVEKFFWAMSEKGKLSLDPASVVSDVLLNSTRGSTDARLLALGTPERDYPRIALRVGRWSDAGPQHALHRLPAW